MLLRFVCFCFFFFFNDTATTEIYTLSLHDALPIYRGRAGVGLPTPRAHDRLGGGRHGRRSIARSEEHTSELQSQSNLVCRLLLEKKKNKTYTLTPIPQAIQRRTHSRSHHTRRHHRH